MFDGLRLSDMGYIVTHDEIVDDTGVVSQMEFNTVNSVKSNNHHKVSSKYEDTLHLDVSIMKHPCNNDSFVLTNDDISEMAKWLCRDEYQWFKWIDDIGQDEIWYQVQITMDKIAYGKDIIGLTLHINTNRPYGLTREYQHEWIGGLSDTIINVHSDEEGYIYPDVEITVKGGGTVEITNHYENRTTRISNCINGEIINIYGDDLHQIVSSNKGHDLSTDFNYILFRLCNKWGNSKNIITVSPNANIVFTYRGVRKVGL